MKNYIIPLALAVLAFASCNKEQVVIPDDQKDVISFSMSDEASATKAGFTGSATTIAMRIQSDEKGSTTEKKYTRTVATAAVGGSGNTDYSTVSFQDAYKRYWDDAHGRKSLLSVYAVAVPNGGSTIMNNGKTLEELLSKGDESNTWGTTATNTIAWQVNTTAQTKDATSATSPSSTIDQEDLTYSNNIQEDATLGTDGVYRWNYAEGKYLPDATGAATHKNGRMLFFQNGMTDSDAATKDLTSDPGHFDKGHLKFTHALSRMTVTLVAGEGFASAPFAFASGTNIKLLGMNTAGTLDIKAGTWSGVTTADIAKMAKTTDGTTAAGSYMAQMLPGYTITDGTNTNVMEFTIDNNTYYITQDMLFDALTYDANGNGTVDSGDGALVGTTSPITMGQGYNYAFTITVNKTAIAKISATLAKWVDVTAADASLNNSHVSFTFKGLTDGTACTDFQFYRLKEDLGSINTTSSYTATTYSGDYKTEGAATLSAMASPNTGKYQTNWFYDDNKTAYHFRTVNALAADEGGSSTTDASENIHNNTSSQSYFIMTANGAIKDYHWGAPMVSTATLAYNTTTGFTSSLHQGITSNESDINVTELHMMSNINIVLKTTTGTDKVVLSGATVTLTQISTSANVDMGTGLITPGDTYTTSESTTAPTTYWKTTDVETNAFTCSVIPQALKRGTGANDTDYIGITITTSDSNQYYIVKKLSEITASSVTDNRNQATNGAITYWYPDHNYTYTFTITKKGIEAITATVAKWVDVTAAGHDVNLES